MIIVIATWEVNEKTGKKEYLVSHGIDSFDDHVVILPQVHPSALGATINQDLNEWVLNG